MQEHANTIIIATVAITLLSILLAGFLVTVLFFYHKKQLLYLQNLDQLKIAHEKNILKTQLEIQEATFEDISREIHDNIGLTLTLAKLQLNTIQLDKRGQYFHLIQDSINLITKSIKDLNDLSKSMKADIVNDVGFIRSIEQQLEKLKATGLFTVKFEICGEPMYMDSQKELILYRIVQEAFNNILKHASAKAIHVILHYSETEFLLKIADDGKGFNEDEVKHKKQSHIMSGLANMKKRAELIAASYKIDGICNTGTTITIQLPL